MSRPDSGIQRVSAPDRPTPLEWLAVGLVVLFLALLAFDGLRKGHIQNGDSNLLVRGADLILDCVSEGTWKGCALIPGTGRTEVGPFPVLQYLPAVVLTALGIEENGVLRALALLNFLALAGSVAAIWATFWKQRAWRWLGPVAVVILISGPVAYYGTTAFGEMLAASVVLAAVLAAFHGSRTLTVVFTALATMAKETLAPFVLGLALLAIVLHVRRSQGPSRALVVSALSGTALGVGINVAFNLFRYGSPSNFLYLDEMLRVPDLRTALDFFAMLNLAPGGGLLFFWPLAWALTLAVLAVALIRLLGAPKEWRDWLPLAGLGAVYLGFMAGLSLWYSPFGWISWGPRLAVPIVPAVVFLGVCLLAPAAERVAGRVFSRGVGPLIGIGLILILASLPQWSGPWAHHAVISTLVTPDATCPALTEIIIQDGPDPYYRCIPHIAWRITPSWLDEALTDGGTSAWVARVLGTLSVVALVGASYQRFRRDQITLEISE